jgi:diguanylate cyclase (GGDEF)-like protein
MLSQGDAWGGGSSCKYSDYVCVPEALRVSELTSVMEDVCFCTFFADIKQQLLYFSNCMLEVIGLPDHAGILLSDFLEFVSEQDRAETAEKYRDFFAAAASGITQKVTFEHSFESSKMGKLWLQVHMYTVTSGETSSVLGTILDRTKFISDRDASCLQKNIINSSTAVVFVANLSSKHIVFSENLHIILPDAELELCGNIRERISAVIFSEDVSRFLIPIEQIISRNSDDFSFEIRICKADRSVIWIASRGKVYYDESVKSDVLVGTIINLSDMNQFKELIETANGRNEITDLPVRKRLVLDLEKVINDRNVLSASIILIDIREFHTYNDRFGRAAGDEILRAISDMVNERLPSGASLFHINIDHFCVLWPHASRVQVENYMAFLHEETENPIIVRDESIYVSYAMSAALFPSCGCSADELLANAEITLNKVKQDRRRHYSIFVPSDKRELTEKLNFESQLSHSIRNTQDNFLLYYQPLVDAHSETLIGAEALLRWISPSKDIISPERVIAALEATGHMDGVGAWVLEQAVCQCSKWIALGISADFVLHVNITAEDLMRPNYSMSVISLLSRYSLDPGNIILEITETSLMQSVSACRQNLIRLRKAGIRISLDDFGTGYSSLNYLRELPVDEIKIDRAFLENIHKDRYNHSFISAMVILAHSIPRHVCIEGIETKEQADTVRALGADVFQGFHFGRPIAASEFEQRFFCKYKNRT